MRRYNKWKYFCWINNTRKVTWLGQLKKKTNNGGIMTNRYSEARDHKNKI